MAEPATIVAAGTVPWRMRSGMLEVGLVHRPRYHDWSLPKGKVDPDEHLLVCAVRETLEETGLHVALGRPLGEQGYPVPAGSKLVHYWAAHADSTAVEVHGHAKIDPAEIDDVRFLPAGQAAATLTYDRDVEIVGRLATYALDTTPLVLLRHAKARSRRDWDGPDRDRPLTDDGRADAARLVQVLAALGIARIVTSDAQRCLQTISPYAHMAGIEAEIEPRISEAGFSKDPHGASEVIHALLGTHEPTVLCTHRPVLPTLRAAPSRFAACRVPTDAPPSGSSLVLHHRAGLVVSAQLHTV
ncbi:MAG TPA: NUDIX hydrolase [Jiangellaceae bacterium]|nr:NUDIX hydrolase [Jiangellaceae bacterium]